MNTFWTDARALSDVWKMGRDWRCWHSDWVRLECPADPLLRLVAEMHEHGHLCCGEIDANITGIALASLTVWNCKPRIGRLKIE